MSDYKYAILIDGSPSGTAFYGQQDVYPVAMARMSDGHYNLQGVGDRTGQLEFVETVFFTHDENDTTIDQNAVIKLKDTLKNMTRNGTKDGKITILKVNLMNKNTKEYQVESSIEHDQCSIGYNMDDQHYTVTSEEAILSETPEGGTSPTNKTSLNFVTRQINANG